MGRVRYAKSMRDLERSELAVASRSEPRRHAIRSMRCVFETDAEAAQAVVPRPLEAGLDSEISVTFARVAVEISPEVTIEIRSACISVRVEYDDKAGWYLLAMPMTSEQAVTRARERFGAPAKLAEVRFDARGESISARVERMGTEFLGLEGLPVEDLPPRTETEYGYCFKAFPSCEPGKGFDQDPQLVRLEWRHEIERVQRLEGSLELKESPFDPIADLPIRRIVAVEAAEGTLQTSGRVLRPVPGDWLLPFMHQRYDDPSVDGVEV